MKIHSSTPSGVTTYNSLVNIKNIVKKLIGGRYRVLGFNNIIYTPSPVTTIHLFNRILYITCPENVIEDTIGEGIVESCWSFDRFSINVIKGMYMDDGKTGFFIRKDEGGGSLKRYVFFLM